MATGFVRNLFIKRYLVIKEDGLTFRDMKLNIYPSQSFAKFLQKIAEKKSEEYLYKLGFEAGYDSSKIELENFGILKGNFPFKIETINLLLQVNGFGILDFKIYDPKNKKALGHITKNPVIEDGVKLFKSKSKVCSFFRGVYSAHAQLEFNLEGCQLTETRCVRNKDPYCEWSYGLKFEK